MIAFLPLLVLAGAAEGAPLEPFDQPARAGWVTGDEATSVRATAVLDSSASAWGEDGVRVRAEGRPWPDRLAVLDLDLDLDLGGLVGDRTLSVGDRLRVRYDELGPGGVVFRSVSARGEVRVVELLRTFDVAALALAFDLELTGRDDTKRRLSGGTVVSEPAPREFVAAGRRRVAEERVVVDAELEVGVGCDGEPVEPTPTSPSGGGCEGDPGPGASSSGGCEGDPGPGPSAGGGCEGGGGGGGGGAGAAGGCAGDPMVRSARAHGPLGLVFALLALRRRRSGLRGA